MSDQDTPKQDPAQEKTETVNWEDRYKSLQSEFTKRTQREKELESSFRDLNQNYEQLTAYITQQNQPKDDETAYQYATQRDIEAMRRQVDAQVQAMNLASEFRVKYPDMVQYEDQVTYYFEFKTDKRKNLRDRMESAVQMTRDFLEAERQRGFQKAEEERQRKSQEEAEASGLSYQPTPAETTKVGETSNEYLAWRKQLAAKRQGIT